MPAKTDDISKELASTDPDPVLARIENNLISTVKEHKYDQLSKDDMQRLFISEYAKLVLSSHFEKVGLLIFGTQIAALRYLHGGSPQPQESLRPFYNDHVAKVNDSDLTDRGNFEIWFNFLVTPYLVAISTESQLCYISDIGRKFLTEYAPASNLNEITRLY